MAKHISRRTKDRNLKTFTVVGSMWWFAIGLFGPFYVIYIQQIGGGLDILGWAIGIMTISQALTSYFVGKASDKIGRKPLLILVGYANAIILFAYTLIQTHFQLYIMQALWGMIDAVDVVATQTFIADMTRKRKRGLQIGTYRTIVMLSSGIAVILGGMVASIYGLKMIFYFCSLIYLVGTTLLYSIKEKRKERLPRNGFSKKIKFKNI